MASPLAQLKKLSSSSGDWVIPASAVGLVFVMLIPMPAMLLDILLAISMTAGVLVLLSAIYILRPVQFSVFPSLLLLLTLFRLSLNLASSRRILLHGNEGAGAAGTVIEAFGQFVVGGNYVVGFVIFLALIAIQFLVVSHGAVRTAEVTARFTLDALPGKQMAIDADLDDGLVTLIPSLLVSVAGGMVVTRTGSDQALGTQLTQQLLFKSQPLWIAGGVMLFLGLIPGLPKLPFFLAAFGTGALARHRMRQENKAAAAITVVSAEEPKKATVDPAETLLKLDELGLEVGYGLVALVDEKQNGQLLQRVRALRRHLAVQLGFMVPPVHITDNVKLKPREYVISLRGVEVARWEMQPECVLAISSESKPPSLPGIETREPAFGVAAKWIAPSQQEQALALGYVVVDQTSALATHISEVIRQYAQELLSRQETKRLLDSLGDTQPKLLEELVPKLLSLGEIQKVLQRLLRE